MHTILKVFDRESDVIESAHETLCSNIFLESNESDNDAPILVHVATVGACETWFLCFVSVVLVFTVVSVSSRSGVVFPCATSVYGKCNNNRKKSHQCIRICSHDQSTSLEQITGTVTMK